ncbi:uncharacterized protein LOC125030427 [Penaeus chinensis]|uniref:uncharacterized protein LOC125030427 n=1 Tax=Penaeus chinensis TaxID=139456 RepID=UPI001FB71505|nr:uncharacterized protein LOC125030427 [Penaeus chinensis]
MKGAENTIGKVKTKGIKKPWVTEEMLVKMDERRSNNAQRGIESKDGELLTNPHGIKKRWKEYIEMLYNKDGRPAELFVEEESEVDKEGIGPDIIRAEMYLEGKWPEDFVKSVMVPLEKKDAKKREDHRTISLISHASQIMLKILRTRQKEAELRRTMSQAIEGRGVELSSVRETTWI